LSLGDAERGQISEAEQMIECKWIIKAMKSEAEQIVENKGSCSEPRFSSNPKLSISLKTKDISEN
jgi:hypothetical protein